MNALVFDCDGVLGETESRGHLAAFNRAFEMEGVPWRWTLDDYRRLLHIGGGKERLLALMEEPRFQRVYPTPASPAERQELARAWHLRKSALFREIVASGGIPPRAGVKRLALEAESRGWPLAVASTSAPESVAAMMRHVFGPELAGRFAVVLAGDIVPRKKPAPDIYLLCAERLGLPPSACFAIEDSAPGLAAARSAGMPCLVTVSEMTAGQDFSGALAVVDSLGEPHDPCCVTIDSLLQWSTAHD